MSLDYYINGVLALSVDKVAMMNSGKISSVEFELQNATTGNGYYLDDFAIGYSNNAHWNLDGNYHSVAAGATASCESGIKCSCGNQIGAALGHDVSDVPAYTASTNTLVYSCERDGCTQTYTKIGYYNDGTTADYLVGTKAEYTITPNVGDGYVTFFNNTGTLKQGEIWAPINGHPTIMEPFSCANNAEGVLSFKVNAYSNDTSNRGWEFKVNSDRNTSNWGGWANSYAIFKIMPVTTDGATTVDIQGLKNAALTTVELAKDSEGNYTKWTGWLDVKIEIKLTDNGNITATYYINDQYIGTQTAAMYTMQRITSVYIAGYSAEENSGLMLDDFAFAYMVPEN